MKISRSEKAFLDAISVFEVVSAVRLRSDLGWDIAKFSKVFQQLMEKGLLTRDGLTLSVAKESEAYFHLKVSPNINDDTGTYLNEVRAPRLDVSLPYLPDYRRFKAAMAKRLYTSNASVDHPD